ncbi:chemotaxis protein CheA [Polynucleobacter sp. AP-Latsch-80-C2]|jgi:two-component system chemotaxis sensor kinase CheA|uniref:chemotaxis protein CheA n=1 Tax=Polynucleobacter sp. AP-Latsch-80-C2 TaxID=2576931 RepID=UPI001C0DB779|nr:chemotaxis protein CheA [Polynucleobacter sp. AP-Latsch-80-C2]MBU3623153.1 chemotaxis protein CheA [Polynucleobacter sp. AP-Latsch-80-C2]
MENHDEILAEFILEAREIIDRLDGDFVRLEENPGDQALVGNIFRGLHTLKGSSGFFSLKRLEKLSHAGESLLGKIRAGQAELDFGKSTRLLEMNDILRSIIEGVEANHVEPSGDDQELIAILLGSSLTPTTQAEEAIFHRVELETPQVPSEIQMDYAEPSESVTTNAPGQELVVPVKVNPEVLDKLMNIASEMVLARNRLLPFSQQSSDKLFTSAVRSIDLLTLELQERMMKMRMQPIFHIWDKFPRLVRDVSVDCGKKVRLLQEGSETELDRILLDSIRDPLIHLIRNSIDHSIETPEVRLEKGKSEIAYLVLRAAHQNGTVIVEVIDDGAGVDYERVRQRAISRGLISLEKAHSLNHKELIDLIFLPGFSTRDTITNLSGRGVGMDVVKNNIENIGGSIEITSVPNEGTHVRLKIPLTLAILPTLFVRCAEEIFLIPQNRILELVRFAPNQPNNGIEDFYGTPTFRLRDKLIPLLFLNEQLNLVASPLKLKQKLFIAVLNFNGTLFGLVVEEVLNIQDIVIKPLGELLRDMSHFAGATIMGNGDVALILDIDGIARQSGLVERLQANPIRQEELYVPPVEEMISVLLFEIPGLNKIALPLDSIDHIIKLDPSQIQQNGNREVVYFNEQLMDLVRLDRYVSGGDKGALPAARAPVLTCRYRDRLYGLVVKQVTDIIEVPAKLHELSSPQKGLNGCIIYNDQVINVLDLEEVLVMHNIQEESGEYPTVIDVYLPN